MKAQILSILLLLAFVAMAQEKILLKESFRSFNNNSGQLQNSNNGYFDWSGIYGLGNNDWGKKPIFTLYKDGRLQLDVQTIFETFTSYENLAWTVVFKVPERCQFSFGVQEIKIDSLTIDNYPHYENDSQVYRYVIRLSEQLVLGGNHFIERSQFPHFQFIDPILIDTIYITGTKKSNLNVPWLEDYKGVNIYSLPNKKVQIIIHNPINIEFKLISLNNGAVLTSQSLSEGETEIPIEAPVGIYVIMISDEEGVCLALKKIFIIE